MKDKKRFTVTVSEGFYEEILRVQDEKGEIGIQSLVKDAVKQYIKRHDARQK